MVLCRLCAVVEGSAAQRWTLDTLSGCELVIGGYPRFRYNATGGRALAEASAAEDGALQLSFDPSQTRIPDLCGRTTRFLGLPLPPGLRIAIAAERLKGLVEPGSGSVQLQFEARFRFEIQLAGALRYRAPDLLVTTNLTTAAIQSRRHRRQGCPLDSDGRGRLVGTAMIAPCGEPWLDRFLGLPDEALAVLDVRLSPRP